MALGDLLTTRWVHFPWAELTELHPDFQMHTEVAEVVWGQPRGLLYYHFSCNQGEDMMERFGLQLRLLEKSLAE